MSHTKRTKPKATRGNQADLIKAREGLRSAGISIKEWAEANGFSRYTVVDVLRGHRVGDRGEAHRVAIALGLKRGHVAKAKGFRPVAGVGA